ncbi:hypothetical protein PFICI_12248 [Pestalotiopsis fici W106-1]|uniref:Uncharacterized protein n=1 Tax=Pestalotiopsis fici (strain W106-1 / CGMCC3.15140) TaxID=1229662 RepID=W3WNE8_PESFW|nr:uncharacterized protein PFICI_12248 [Pestalotiopsis fici W106-1]ETS75304.1 hypothetical protein PFICI_12248 [Pestalotiopsis fici W106-1]
MRNAQQEEIPGQALAQIWRPVVNAFTATGITKPTDRLIALYGVGSRIKRVCGWPYVAGMFLKNLQSQLCWKVTEESKSTRPETPIAPTWSWASISSPVNMMPQWELIERDETGEGPQAGDLNKQYLCDVLSIEPGTSAAENSGHTSSATLHVSCHLVPATIFESQPLSLRFNPV